MKSNSNIRPSIIEPLGNGAYHYNYNIVERQETDPETGEIKTVYDYDTVKVWDEPTYDKLVKAVIRATFDETQELSIINEYNAGVLGVTTDKADKEDAKKAYKDYLTFVAETKAKVKADLEAVED
uniref:Uncharacterized protein n=1 Tax=Siphoviridae sp. cttm829 TaxID=2825707 RepID=A0A8S5PE80_9CAUD|nr:MAG TPA: hypothetical protein [Siphoviridae sp. cttm829]